MHWDHTKHLTQYWCVLLLLSISGHATVLAGDPLTGNSLVGVSKIDSLWQVFAKTGDDSMRATLLIDISDEIDDTSATEAIIYTLQAHDLLKNNGYELLRARTLNILGYYHWSLGAFDDANKYYNEALQIYEAHGDSILIGKVANNLGVSYWGLSNYNAALPYFQRALAIRKQQGESKGIALILNNIGLIYQEWGLYKKALQYHEEALEISIRNHQLSARAYSYNNIGRCQESMHDYESALRYFQLSLHDYLEEGGIGAATSLCYYDIGNIYYTLSQLDSALSYYQQSWHDAEKVKNKHRKTIAENKIAVILAALGQYDEAEAYVWKSLRTAQSQNYHDLVRDNHYLLSEIAEGRGDISGAFQYFKTASIINDSLFNSESLAKFTEFQVKYSIEKEVSENLELTASNKIQELRLSKNKLYTNLLIILSAFILIVAALIYNRSRILKRSKDILKKQYDDIYSLNTENESLISKLEQQIHERKQAEEARRESEENFRAIIETSPDGISITDLNGTVQFVTQKFVKMLGYEEPGELLGKNTLEFIHPSTHAKVLSTIKDKIPDMINKNLTIVVERMMLRKQGSSFFAESHASILRNADNDPVGLLYINRDISGRKQEEEVRLDLEAKLRESKRLEAIGTMVGGVAHEFNNALQSLFLYAGLVKDQLPEEQPIKDDFEHLLARANNAKHLVEQVMLISSLDSGQPEQIVLADLISDVVNLKIGSRLSVNNVELSLAEGCPPLVADKQQIQTVLEQVIDNAILAIANGGDLSVSLECNEHTTENSTQSRRVQLTITDTGVGMTEETLSQAFNPFFTTREVGQGKGFGLSIVYNILQNMGASISATSLFGEGSSFIIEFPLAIIPEN